MVVSNIWAEYRDLEFSRMASPGADCRFNRPPRGFCVVALDEISHASESTRGEPGEIRPKAQPRRPSAASRTTREEGPVSYTFVYWAVYESILCSRDQYREERPLIPGNPKRKL